MTVSFVAILTACTRLSTDGDATEFTLAIWLKVVFLALLTILLVGFIHSLRSEDHKLNRGDLIVGAIVLIMIAIAPLTQKVVVSPEGFTVKGPWWSSVRAFQFDQIEGLEKRVVQKGWRRITFSTEYVVHRDGGEQSILRKATGLGYLTGGVFPQSWEEISRRYAEFVETRTVGDVERVREELEECVSNIANSILREPRPIGSPPLTEMDPTDLKIRTLSHPCVMAISKRLEDEVGFPASNRLLERAEPESMVRAELTRLRSTPTE